MAGRNRCAAPGCQVLADRNRKVCVDCWAKVPDNVQRFWLEITIYCLNGDTGAQRVRIVLWRQLLEFWSGGEPNGMLWRGVDLCTP
jgi:hypothetical protein